MPRELTHDPIVLYRNVDRKFRVTAFRSALAVSLLMGLTFGTIGFKIGCEYTNNRNAELVDKIFANKVHEYRETHPESNLMEVVLLQQARDEIYVKLR